MNREELAWAAGFWDGEGSTSLMTTNKRPNQPEGQKFPRLYISQVEKEPLIRFNEALGGIFTVKRRKQSRRETHCWFISTNRFELVQATLTMLWPFLTEVKRNQALKTLQAYHSDQSKRRHYGSKRKST